MAFRAAAAVGSPGIDILLLLVRYGARSPPAGGEDEADADMRKLYSCVHQLAARTSHMTSTCDQLQQELSGLHVNMQYRVVCATAEFRRLRDAAAAEEERREQKRLQQLREELVGELEQRLQRVGTDVMEGGDALSGAAEAMAAAEGKGEGENGMAVVTGATGADMGRLERLEQLERQLRRVIQEERRRILAGAGGPKAGARGGA